MKYKVKEDDIKRDKNHTNFIDEVRKAYDGLPYMRKSDLIEKLELSHKNMIGYSKVTIGRKIENLCKERALVKVYRGDFEKYGIRKSALNAVYLLFKETTEIKEHIDDVLKILDSDNPRDINLVLGEINSYRNRYVFDGTQLDTFVEKLEIKDDRIRYSLFMLIFEQINRGIEPTNIAQLKDVLKTMLKEYPLESYKQHGIRSIVIQSLGYYEEPIVIDQLIKDAEALNEGYSNQLYSSLSAAYSNQAVAKIIEANRKRLFAVERKLIKENKENGANLISSARSSAIMNLDNLSRTKQKVTLSPVGQRPQ